MTRYECFKASRTGETIYSIWLGQKMVEWSVSGEGRRAKELEREKRDGWQFPILYSQQDHDEFDAWLNEDVRDG